MNAIGIVAGLGTALLWAFTAICFETATKRLGTLSVNVLRLVIAALLFLGLSALRTGSLFPTGLSAAALRDLVLSGVVGFVVGDLLLFQALADIGARLSMLVYASVPAMTSVAGALFLGEALTSRAVTGMGITVSGIAFTVLSRKATPSSRILPHRTRGILLALGGSAGQTAGLLLGKRGAVGVDAFAATEVRVLAGLSGFLFIMLALGRRSKLPMSFRGVPQQERQSYRIGLLALCAGAVLGPFLGVSLGLKSMQLLPAGVAATLMATVPAMLIPISAILLRERITWRESIGAVLALVGVAVLVT